MVDEETDLGMCFTISASSPILVCSRNASAHTIYVHLIADVRDRFSISFGQAMIVWILADAQAWMVGLHPQGYMVTHGEHAARGVQARAESCLRILFQRGFSVRAS